MGSDNRREAMYNQSEARADLLNGLRELCSFRPEWRLGETMAIVAMSAGHMEAGAVWNLEGEEALAAVRSLLAESRRPESVSD